MARMLIILRHVSVCMLCYNIIITTWYITGLQDLVQMQPGVLTDLSRLLSFLCCLLSFTYKKAKIENELFHNNTYNIFAIWCLGALWWGVGHISLPPLALKMISSNMPIPLWEVRLLEIENWNPILRAWDKKRSAFEWSAPWGINCPVGIVKT